MQFDMMACLMLVQENIGEETRLGKTLRVTVFSGATSATSATTR